MKKLKTLFDGRAPRAGFVIFDAHRQRERELRGLQPARRIEIHVGPRRSNRAAPEVVGMALRSRPIARITHEPRLDGCVGKTNGVGLSRSKFEEGAGRGSCAVPGVTDGRRQAGG